MTDEFANKLRRALDGNADAFFSIDSSDFDEWLESHDAEVRMDAIIARDTRTPVELIRAAWEAAYPLPEGRKIPAGVTIIVRWDDGEIRVHAMGRIPVIPDRVEVRTLEPLPPVIPDDCNLVWSGNPDRRVVWHRDPSNPDRWNGYDVAGHAANLHRDNLIDPVPVPKEERDAE